MSFHPKNLWVPRDAACIPNGEMNSDRSLQNEGKRSHQWFMDTSASGPELLSNKRQAVEAVTSEPVQGSVRVFPWDNNSNFQSLSGQHADQLGGSEAMRSINLVDRHVPSLNAGEMGMGRKLFDDQYGSESAVSLSMSHGADDPSLFLNFGGIRKVKVNEVRDPENSFSASMGDPFQRGDPAYNKGHGSTMSLGTGYHNRDENGMPMDAGFSKIGENFLSAGQSFNKEDSNLISMGQSFDSGGENMLSMDRSFPKGDGQFITMGPPYAKGETGVMSMASSFDKDHANFISMGANIGKMSENFISVGSSYGKVEENMLPITRTYDKASSNIIPTDSIYQKGDPNTIMMGQNYRAQSNFISFGGFLGEQEINESIRMIGNYRIMLDNDNLPHTLEVPGQKNMNLSSGPIVNSCSTSKVNTIGVKNKEPKTAKKPASNNFPSNVKSLLSTGMLDGVPVKYVSWSREKNLRGIISGPGYLCSCSDCNLSKVSTADIVPGVLSIVNCFAALDIQPLNAYEFERHAGCKTKHPNNHIYFENGKTIYAVVQELKNTPQELLFDAIQTVTGAPIDQKNYRAWKASYQAATHELQRIYGKDEIILPP